jgi:7,8-dihydroneopterin aldolase/epimerase/oxygenase
MTDDTALAFAHPEDRAAATAGQALPDRISLRDHVVDADIGAFQQERGHRQRVRFNVVVEVQPLPADLADDVDRVLSYDRIVFAIAAELAAGRLNLLESLVEGVAGRLLAEPQAARVFVRAEKLDVGPYALGVEIVRVRPKNAVAAVADTTVPPPPAPTVAHLDNAMIAGSDLAERLDRLEAMGAPVILTVGLPDLPRAQTGHRPTQARIDLLAIEQNAWTLAARDARCVVVSSRTEMDWAARRGQTVVWAPSKLVLDTPGAPKGQSAAELSLWLADLVSARTFVHAQGLDLPGMDRLTCRVFQGA